MHDRFRRDTLRRGLNIMSLAAALFFSHGRADAADVCVKPESEPLRTSLHYADPAPDPKQACKACGFFSAEEKSNCGRCMIMTGPVNANAHCDSWSAKT